MVSAVAVFLTLIALSLPQQLRAQDAAGGAGEHTHHMHHDMHRMDMAGMVMNENTNRLPRDCAQIAAEQAITVRAGTQHAQQFNGTMFTYDRQEWQVEPCSKVTVTLINDDNVRHQWMIHGLPRYLYPEGMFHLEVNGRGQKAGTFIVPSAKKTYLVHCDLAHHMEKGMKAQLKVGGGNGDLPSIPGITGPRQPDSYPVQEGNLWIPGLTLVAGLAGAVLVVGGLRRKRHLAG
ncbi:MAG: copper oxidase [Candidatus Binatia bacterium]